MKFEEWLKIRFLKTESLRTHQERDPFARQTVVGRPVDAQGKTCDWCGSEGKNGKLYQYTVESDGGRDSQVKGLFCCKDCMKQYHGE